MGHAFVSLGSGRPVQEPVKRGGAARAFLEESGEAAKALEEAMRSALDAGGDREFLPVARATLAKIAEPLGVELDNSGLSARSLATLHASYRELTGAPPPAA
jgi:hypothetical protein